MYWHYFHNLHEKDEHHLALLNHTMPTLLLSTLRPYSYANPKKGFFLVPEFNKTSTYLITSTLACSIRSIYCVTASWSPFILALSAKRPHSCTNLCGSSKRRNTEKNQEQVQQIKIQVEEGHQNLISLSEQVNELKHIFYLFSAMRKMCINLI